MTKKKLEGLSVPEKAIWNFAKSLDIPEVDGHLILIINGALKYLFVKQYKNEIKGGSLYEKTSNISLESILSEKIWDARAVEFGYENLHYELFSVKSESSDNHWFRETLKNIRHYVTLVITKGNSKIEVDATYQFPPLNQSDDRTGREVRRFFRERRINSGDYLLTSVSEYLLAAALNPVTINDFIKNNVLAGNYFSFEDQSNYRNSLKYRAAEDDFEFRILVMQDPEETAADLVARIKPILELIFDRIENYFKSEDDEAGLSLVLGYSGDEFDQIWEAILTGGMFEHGSDELFRGWEWVSPEIVTISIMRVEIDPSRGTPDWKSMKIREYSETRSSWHHTNFAKIEPQAYLDRLEDPDRYPSWFEPRKSRSPKVPSKERLEKSMRIEDFDFTVRTYNCLKREGINTLGDLISLTEVQLGQIKNMAPRQVDEVLEGISSLGLGHLIKPSLWPFNEE